MQRLRARWDQGFRWPPPCQGDRLSSIPQGSTLTFRQVRMSEPAKRLAPPQVLKRPFQQQTHAGPGQGFRRGSRRHRGLFPPCSAVVPQRRGFQSRASVNPGLVVPMEIPVRVCYLPSGITLSHPSEMSPLSRPLPAASGWPLLHHPRRRARAGRSAPFHHHAAGASHLEPDGSRPRGPRSGCPHLRADR